jgi:hypothetical protein
MDKIYFVLLEGKLPWITGCSKPDETPEMWCVIKRRCGGFPSEEAFSEEDLRKFAQFCEENGMSFRPVPIQAWEPMPEVSDLGPYGHGHFAGLDFCYFSSGNFWNRAAVRAWAARA